MSITSYEVHYWPMHGRADVARMMLEASGKEYKNVLIDNVQWANELKSKARFGHVPKLVVNRTDKPWELSEQVAIDTYLAESLGYLPLPDQCSDHAFGRAFAISHYSSLLELANHFSDLMKLPTPEERRAKVDELLSKYIPFHLGCHDKILGEVPGPFYGGEQVSLADFTFLSVALRLEELLGDRNPLPNFTNLVKLKESVLAIPGVKTYVESKRDFGVLGFDPVDIKVVLLKK